MGGYQPTSLRVLLTCATYAIMPHTISSRGLIAISLDEGDELRWARACTAGDTLVIATADGYASRFETSDTQMRPTGRTSRGVRSIRLRAGDAPVDCDVIPAAVAADEGATLLALTERGYGKRVPLREFKTQKRGGMGVIATKFKAAGKGGAGDRLACLRRCADEDEVMRAC